MPGAPGRPQPHDGPGPFERLDAAYTAAAEQEHVDQRSDQAVLVSGDDGLNSVAQVEFGEQA